MKKKIAALLTAALVMTMSTATVFAAVSPSWDNANGTVDTDSVVSTGVTGTVTVNNNKTLNSTEEQGAKEELKTVLEGISNVTGADVQAVVEITGTVATGETATVTVKVSGINAGDNVIVLHYVNNAWQTEKARVDANGNVVIEGLTSFSPFVFVKYTVQNTAPEKEEGIPAWWYLLQERQAEAEAEELQTSPKTGVVIPVAAMTAGICLAGAAVCGKKVKFN